MNNMNEILSGMKIRITAGEFHRIHDAAMAAEKVVQAGGLEKLSSAQLLDLLKNLQAGQRLTNAEDDVDAIFAHSYSDSIATVEREIKRLCRR